MIVPMKKVSLVLLNNERTEALKKLRKLGVMHLEQIEGRGETLKQYKDNLDTLEVAVSLMSDLKLSKKIKQKDADTEEAIKTASEIVNLYDNRKILEDKVAAGNAELERLELWGEVDTDAFAYLAKKGIRLYLYEIQNSKYFSLPDTVQTIFVNRDKTTTRFLLIGTDKSAEEAVRPEDLPPEAYSITLPEQSTAVIAQNIVQYKKEIEKIGKQIIDLGVYTHSLKKALVLTKKTVEFENISSGMEREEEGTYALAWLTGFVPVGKMTSLKECAEKEHWAFCAEDPSEEDNVPTQLKNSSFVRLLYPVLDFLGTVPGYREYDITLWFLLFFTIFFAMIFGDAGYGSLLLLIGIGGTVSSLIKKTKVPLIMPLIILLACATIVWGTLTCSWFGIAYDSLPPVLQNLSFWAVSNANPESSTNIQIFCFSLALAQLSIGHLTALFRNIKEKSLKLLADIGSLGILWGMFTVVLSLLVSAERFPITNITFGLIGGGFLLSFIFADYEGNIGKSILSSLKNIISVLLGVINFFSDIVSYIRLWAVGLAGAAIAETVNTMAGPLLGNFLIFLGVLLLIFGHGLNMVLNLLSVIVHGVRLNTLEFTGHVGMTWSGFKYEPFTDK